MITGDTIKVSSVQWLNFFFFFEIKLRKKVLMRKRQGGA